MRKFILTLLILTFTHLLAKPKEVYIVRNAEESSLGTSLSLKGRERAAALAPFFMGSPDFTTPTALYTTNPNAPGDAKRSYQTLLPLSIASGVPIHSYYGHGQEEAIAKEILEKESFGNHIVLIAWVNSKIPDLALFLGAKDAPKEWQDTVFDRVWKIRYEGDEVLFSNHPQALMFGDARD